MAKPDNRIPVTILTGFLGAGKTTLLNELIEKYPNKKLAIIENEFGEVPIDNELVIRPEEGIFEMSNGCICCTLNDELVETLAQLIESEHKFNHLLLETTGVAEPDAVAAAFLATPEVQGAFKLDGVVCVADAHFLEEIVQERDEARAQLTFADFVVLNKASEVHPDQLQKLKEIIREANPFATIETTDFCKIKADVLNLRAYDADQLEKKLRFQLHEEHDHDHHDHHEHHHHEHEEDCEDCKHDPEHKHHHHEEHHHHEHEEDCEDCKHDPEHKHTHKHHKHKHTDIMSESFVFNEPLDMVKFRHWVNVILMVQNQSFYRIKGILNFAWQDCRMVFQSVQQLFVFQRGSEWKLEDKKESKIVFIGKGLRRDILEKSLKHCYYDPDDLEEY